MKRGGCVQPQKPFRIIQHTTIFAWARLPGFAGYIYLYKCQAFTRKALI